MCGIYGMHFKKDAIKSGQRALLSNYLAVLNDERGGHSWGVLGIEGKNKSLVRGLGDLGDNAYEVSDLDVFFAHTRFATHGAKTIANCHPFSIGDIIGAHNGVIWNHESLNKKYGRKYEVDSMHLFAHLDSGLAFDDISGYGSIQWVNRKDLSKIFLCRMDGGQLAVYGIGTEDDVKGIVWTSDDDHAIEAFEKAGIKNYFAYRVDEAQVYYVENGNFYITDAKLELDEGYTGQRFAWNDFEACSIFRPDGKGGFIQVDEDDEDMVEMAEIDDDEAKLIKLQEIAERAAEEDSNEDPDCPPYKESHKSHSLTDRQYYSQEWEDFCRGYYANKIENQEDDGNDEGYGG